LFLKKGGFGGLPQAGCGAAALLLLGIWTLDWAFPLPLDRLTGRSTVVLETHGQLLRPFPTAEGTWRLPTRPTEVDPLYLAMLYAIEDQRFGWHPGLDPLAVGRALFQATREGRVVSGASTLTMQVARLLTPAPRTLRAKLREAARALQLQAHLGRSGVLEAYLTLAPFGGPLEGVSAATLAWFGKMPRHLTPAEAALLVALPQSPERLRPDRHPAAARAARDRVLDRAVARGLLAADLAHAAKAEPVPLFQRALPQIAPHLTERLAAQAGRGTVIRTTLDGTLQKAVERLGRAQLARLEEGANLAIVVLDNRDRRLLASLGSGEWRSQQIDLTRATRSPGSTLKPFIYALAFDELSLHPGTLIEDSPRRFGDWMPRNFDHDFHGPVTAREALQRSLNIPAVAVLEKIGPARLTAALRQSGVDLSFPARGEPGLPLALGGVGVRLIDLAMLFAALEEGGEARPILEQPDQPSRPPYRLVGAAAARAVIDVLEGSPMPDGLAAAVGLGGRRRVAFKTGTSFGFRDAWTVGTSPDYTVAVWVGRPDGASRPGEMGRAVAAPILFRVFDLLPPDHAPRAVPREPDHALFHRRPPPALAWLNPETRPRSARRPASEPPRILFPPDGGTVELIDEGIALSATGGRAPLRWIADGHPLGKGSGFWRPEGEGFARLAVVDAEGRSASATIRVVAPE